MSFPSGLILVQGIDKDTDKSNGSGKSSITEIIPFALFGKTIKDIPQGKIINWNNRSGCEVELYFDVGDKSYVFRRSLKPNKFSVLCDGLEIVRAADIRVFQQQMEDEVIGMDFKTFKNLIYFSPNNTISILGAKKEQKRQFLESLFDLSHYSEMLKVTNERIRNYSSKVKELEINILSNEQNIDFIKGTIDDMKDIDISLYDKSINKMKFELEALNEVKFDTENLKKYDETKARLVSLNNEARSLSNKITELSTTISHTEGDIRKSDISTIQKKVDSIEKEISDIQDKISINDDDISDMLVRLAEIKTNMGVIKTDMDTLDNIRVKLSSDISVKKHILQDFANKVKDLSEADKLDGMVTCPTCKQNVDPDHIKEWYEMEMRSLETQRYEVSEEMSKIQETISKVEIDISDLRDGEVELLNEGREIKNKIEEYRSNIKKIENLKTNLSMLPSIDDITKDIEDKKSQLKSLNEEIESAKWKYSLVNDDITFNESLIRDMDKLRVEIDNHKTRLINQSREIDTAIENLNNLLEIKKDQENKIVKMNEEIVKYDNQIKDFDREIKKINKMIDYLNFIRVSLKDENVKQFAISALLPYLNHRANYYLTESGFPYIVDIDGWLDVTIKGMGTEDVGYNSLSGGEGKAMDMAVQLACNDIAEIQAKTSLGISINDEILDTSLDADGVQKIMSIIRVKQRDSGNCVICITHRDEIKELDFDYNLMIVKQNGFSSIQPQ